MNKDFSNSSKERNSYNLNKEITDLDNTENLKDRVEGLDAAIELYKEEVKTKIKNNSDKIKDIKKDLKARTKELKKDITQQQWLRPTFLITIILTCIGAVSGSFYHINFRVDNSHSRIDKIDDSTERICQIIETLSSHVNGDDIPQLPDCLP